jgi:GH43 family beta-xylosidase
MEDTGTPLQPAKVEDILLLTEEARALPPSADQTNVLISDGADPWVLYYEGSYFYCTRNELGDRKKILVSKFDSLTDLATAPLVEVWPRAQTAIPEYVEVWAPELQIIDGKPYIYATLYKGNTVDGEGPKERIHCFEGTSTDPQDEYVYKNPLLAATDRWSIDGSVIDIKGRRYFIWSGWEGTTNHSQNIYIAEMSNPWTLISDRVCISRPELPWEKVGYPYINEGPQALLHDDKIFIIYSASGSWTDDYCLGQLTYVGGDPLDDASWRKEPEPVFQKTDSIFGVGHCCFVKDAEGRDWILYHAARASGAAWARQVRAKVFTWHEDGSPDFGTPV